MEELKVEVVMLLVSSYSFSLSFSFIPVKDSLLLVIHITTLIAQHYSGVSEIPQNSHTHTHKGHNGHNSQTQEEEQVSS